MRRPGRRTVIALTAVVGLLAVVGVGGAVYVQQTLDFGPPPTFDTTAEGSPPAGADCRVVSSAAGGVAIELLDLGADEVYLADGDDAISREEFAETSVRFPHTKNSERFVLFDEACFYRSYNAPEDCRTEQECFVYRDLYDHSWVALNGLSGQACLPDEDGCDGDVVEPGHLSVTVIDKCQTITFSGDSINVLSNGMGDEFVMHATADDAPDLQAPLLPEGWTLTERPLDGPLTVRPHGDGHCYHPIVRDNTLQSYHQITFAGAAWTADEL